MARSPNPPRSTTTRWGDREQRRLDILEAARRRIATSGYLSLNMRDLAAAAGISPATLYSYFATKEELFATLYAEAIRAYTTDLEPIAAADHDLVTLLSLVIERFTELYRTFGRHFTLWSAMRNDGDAADSPVPKALIVELRDATLRSNRLFMHAIRAAAARDGTPITADPLVASFLWSALTGLADHFTSERGTLDGFPPEQLIRFAAARLARAITDDPLTTTPPPPAALA